MPVFTDLEKRVNEAPFDSRAYQRRLPECQEIAQSMPLVHVTGHQRPFQSTVQAPPHEIPTSEDDDYYSDLTRSAEDRTTTGVPGRSRFVSPRDDPSMLVRLGAVTNR